MLHAFVTTADSVKPSYPTTTTSKIMSTTTPWNKVCADDEEYTRWLTARQIGEAEFNSQPLLRASLRTSFETYQRKREEEEKEKSTAKPSWCNLKYGRSVVAVVDLDDSAKEPEALIAEARRRFGLDIPRLRLRYGRDNDSFYTSVSKFNSGMTLTVENLQKGFSQVTNEKQALQLCGPNTVMSPNVRGLIEPMAIVGDNASVQKAISVFQTLERVAPIAGGCEATRRLYIDPILYAAAEIVGTVTMKVAKRVESEMVNGDVDYLFQNSHVPPLTVCVTEGKHEHHEKGVIQNIAQLSAVRDTRRRLRPEIREGEPVFGIATTFLTWQFLVLYGDTVHVSELFSISVQRLTEDAHFIISMVAQMLQHGTSLDVTVTPPAKRQRMEEPQQG